MNAAEIRNVFRDNITTIVAVFDAHDPGVFDDGSHECPCGHKGTEAEWEQHLAEAVADKLTESVVELPNPEQLVFG
jgi:hypothetical protein